MEISLPIGQSISEKATPQFYNEHDALAYLRGIRWPTGIKCPRCGSADVREVQTSRVIEALSCRDCRYNFTTTADSYFHGSRIPTFVHLQFIAVVGLEPESSASRIARFFDWKPTTVSRQLARMEGLLSGDFIQRAENHEPFENFNSVASYLEQPAVISFFCQCR